MRKKKMGKNHFSGKNNLGTGEGCSRSGGGNSSRRNMRSSSEISWPTEERG
jgi:hypothetical protein